MTDNAALKRRNGRAALRLSATLKGSFSADYERDVSVRQLCYCNRSEVLIELTFFSIVEPGKKAVGVMRQM